MASGALIRRLMPETSDRMRPRHYVFIAALQRQPLFRSPAGGRRTADKTITAIRLLMVSQPPLGRSALL
jgi:hypothetical protein